MTPIQRRFVVVNPNHHANPNDASLAPAFEAVAQGLHTHVMEHVIPHQLLPHTTLIANYADPHNHELILAHLKKAKTYAEQAFPDNPEAQQDYIFWAYADLNHAYLNHGNALQRPNGRTAQARLVLGGIAPMVRTGYHANPKAVLAQHDITPLPILNRDTHPNALILPPSNNLHGFLDAFMAFQHSLTPSRYPSHPPTVAGWVQDMQKAFPHHTIRPRDCPTPLIEDIKTADIICTVQSAVGPQALAMGKRVVGMRGLCPLGDGTLMIGEHTQGVWPSNLQANALAQILDVQAPLTRLAEHGAAHAMLEAQASKARNMRLGCPSRESEGHTRAA